LIVIWFKAPLDTI